MKKPIVAIGYPPISSAKGTPLLSQNRQFQYFNSPTYIYPMVPAYAASLVKTKGYEVYWVDGIAEKKTYQVWLSDLKKKKPDFLMMESKTPVIKTHWKQISDLKKTLPKMKIILVGDHVTFMPIESFEKSKVDYILKGGDYDFLLLNLLNHIYKGEKLEGGIFWRREDKNISTKAQERFKILKGVEILSSGPISLKHNLDDLPFVDRDLTKWWLYAYENGNYKYTPATYMYSGRDCWYGRCTFCVWDHTLNPIGSYRSFSPERLFTEVKHVVDNYGVKEIFDDAGTMFIGQKLKKFCELLIESGYNKKVKYGCNMRLNALKKDSYDILKKAGFRFILYGMESGNQKTLDRLSKGLKVEQIVEGARLASKAGLEPHITIMLGYPWETLTDTKKTIELAKQCFQKGYFNTMQATIVIPYPGTPLYKECLQNDWLLTRDYDRFDMREPVMKIPFSHDILLELEQNLYSSFMNSAYIMRKLLGIRSFHDFKYLFYMGRKLIGHLLDFDPGQTKVRVWSPDFLKNALSNLIKHLLTPAKALDL